jgi:hypothetical protein
MDLLFIELLVIILLVLTAFSTSTHSHAIRSTGFNVFNMRKTKDFNKRRTLLRDDVDESPAKICVIANNINSSKKTDNTQESC